MRFYNTKNRSIRVDLRTAILQGLARDGGLFMPDSFGSLDKTTIQKIPSLTFAETAFETGKILFQDSLPHEILEEIIRNAISFDAPLKPLPSTSDTAVLELFWGPTLSFKDFGARFMARLMAHFIKNESRELVILVATSGDTGSAVASAFCGIEGIRVFILYPSRGVSEIQEKQLTTWGSNLTALEIEGTFDDCQRLVKYAFQDESLAKEKMLASANSINIGRLFPQSFYYAWAYAQSVPFNTKNLPLVMSVPSGNFGNLTAGLIAKKIGIPIAHFIAATNKNDVVPEYLASGVFTPRPSSATISNAMDVGNPSNFARMMELYPGGSSDMKKDIQGQSFTDEQTRECMKRTYQQTGYVLDPHGAVAYLGLQADRKQVTNPAFGIFLETAHPAKFLDTVQQAISFVPEMPDRLAEVIKKEKKSIRLSAREEEFKTFLIS